MSTLDAALGQFEATESNLTKLDSVWSGILSLLPDGPVFGAPVEYEELCLAFRQILPALPAIDGFRIQDRLLEFDAVAQMRLDALELNDVEVAVAVENGLDEQGRQLRDYRFRLQAKRRLLVRDRQLKVIDDIDGLLRSLNDLTEDYEIQAAVPQEQWSRLKEAFAEIGTLLGGAPRPNRWSDLQRHLHFGKCGDLRDIVTLDWPAMRESLRSAVYGKYDPVPVAVTDLGEVVAARPTGPVTTKLRWSILSDEDFERLLFLLISETPGYENPAWLQQTHAPDRGRDLSVTRVEVDQLAGVRRYRVIIQCKHWLTRSITSTDVVAGRGQMELWQPPRVDELIFATTGRFTADAIALVEQHNQSDKALSIGMWPDSHMERLLASRPHLIGEFRLRQEL